MIPHSVRYLAGRICCTLGMLWAAAGGLKELFGTTIALPLLPPLDLPHFRATRAMFIGFCLYSVGSWLVRFGDPSPKALETEDDSGVTPSQLASGFPLGELPISRRRSKDRA